MPFYRIGEPGQDLVAHLNFGRKAGPAACVGRKLDGDGPSFGDRCGRVSEALCDAPAGEDLSGKTLTCDAPICKHHRTPGGNNVDYCPRHKHLAPARLEL